MLAKADRRRRRHADHMRITQPSLDWRRYPLDIPFGDRASTRPPRLSENRINFARNAPMEEPGGDDRGCDRGQGDNDEEL